MPKFMSVKSFLSKSSRRNLTAVLEHFAKQDPSHENKNGKICALRRRHPSLRWQSLKGPRRLAVFITSVEPHLDRFIQVCPAGAAVRQI